MSSAHASSAAPGGVAIHMSLLLGTMVTAMVAWACLAHIDMVITARGQLVPTDQVHTVQAAESGVVQTRWVKEGDTVQAGQTLITLSPAFQTQDMRALQHEHQQARLNLSRVEAELAGMDLPPPSEDTPSAPLTEARERLAAHRAAHRAALADAQAQIDQARAAISVAQAHANRVDRGLAMLAEQASAFQKLQQEGHVSVLMAQEKQQAWQDQHAEWLTQQQVLSRERQQLVLWQARLSQIVAQYNKALQDERGQWSDRLTQLTDALEKAKLRQSLLTVTAPTGGTIQGAPLPNPGTVVTAGMPLLHIVPDNAPLEAEIWLSNVDRPHVHQGQTVTLKLDAWPYTKHGTITGTLRHLDPAAQAVNTESLPSRTWGSTPPLPLDATRPYRAYVTINPSARPPGVQPWQAGQKLQPGLLTQADIRVGERTVMAYLLSPLLQTFQEAGREPS